MILMHKGLPSEINFRNVLHSKLTPKSRARVKMRRGNDRKVTGEHDVGVPAAVALLPVLALGYEYFTNFSFYYFRISLCELV